MPDSVVLHPDSGLPVGIALAPKTAERPSHCVLEGRLARLEPLDAARHGRDLFAATHGADQDAIWAYMGDGPYSDEVSFLEALKSKAQSVDPLYFTIIDRADGRAKGYATLMRIDCPNRVIEVGNIVYGRDMQKTPLATEVQFLLMRHAFETLGFRRYEWKCNALNAPSRRAAERYGFSYEGLFRQHMIIKGRNRDTAWYAMLDSEWPQIKAAFEQWLAPDNFTPDGQQKQSLASLRGSTHQRG
jgi:RimJ/RimL family protein N-acetyltransferase